MRSKITIFIFLILIISIFTYLNKIGPVSNNKTTKIITIEKGMSYLSITNLLKKENLIKSKFFYKMYIKLNNPKPLKYGVYKLNETMGIKDIIKALTNDSEKLLITVPEGKHLEKVATIVSEKTLHKKEDILSAWNDLDFIDEIIEKYEFIDKSIKKEGIRYPLEGYLFPSTYELANLNEAPELIAFKMLDQMNVIYNKYKEEINKSFLSFHEILTLASIIEYEAILDEERPIIAGVFYNRLNDNMKLKSCATIGYAINEWKLTYNKNDMNVDSPYNTYKYLGLPIGPGNMPGEKSIEAVLYPKKTDYYYFLAIVFDNNSKESYFSKTYKEHQQKCVKYLGYEC